MVLEFRSVPSVGISLFVLFRWRPAALARRHWKTISTDGDAWDAKVFRTLASAG
jgi:hypothetical protein